MRWNGSRHFELRATPHAAGGPHLRFVYILDAVADDDLYFGEHALV